MREESFGGRTYGGWMVGFKKKLNDLKDSRRKTYDRGHYTIQYSPNYKSFSLDIHG